jgi:hypothetical protein
LDRCFRYVFIKKKKGKSFLNVENSSSCPGSGSFVIMLNFSFSSIYYADNDSSLGFILPGRLWEVKKIFFLYLSISFLLLSGSCAAAANVQRERSESIVKFHDGKKKQLAAGPFFCFPTPLFDIKNSQKPSESAERESAYTIIG